MLTDWPCPLPGGEMSSELAVAFETGAKQRVLVMPALFDEANKTRHQIIEIMRRLSGSGIDCALPDLPGMNESCQSLEQQTLLTWRDAAAAAAEYFHATHVLAVRAGVILAPRSLPGWSYAAAGGKQTIRSLLRARLIASREAGQDETAELLDASARRDGIELAGYRLGAAMYSALSDTDKPVSANLRDVPQADLGAGGGLWLRAEPDYDAGQADALAAIIAMDLV
ncbi:hypothetical protein [Altererythrobacter aquiaggeris]|uniref:hypothetical protein n=1 Tax=Aestuarierythrobacter aquiaggeris TaxID=1898396 RepID=UPI003016ED27